MDDHVTGGVSTNLFAWPLRTWWSLPETIVPLVAEKDALTDYTP